MNPKISVICYVKKRKSTDFKFKASFSSKITKISGAEVSKYISLAGLDRLKSLMPAGIDLQNNPDLMGITLNAAVLSYANLNGDSITNEDGVKIAKNFIWKPVSFEHDRSKVIGVICNAGFSKFGSNEILTEEQALLEKEPINLSLAILLYSSNLSDEYIEELEESSDETSEKYGCLSASWELFFNEYDIAESPSRNLFDAKIIGEGEAGKYEECLQANGGTGKKEQNHIFRVIKKEMLIPAGIGIVANPASAVKGLHIVEIEKPVEEKPITSSESVIQVKTQNFMKLNSIKELNDENLKECKASVISDLYETEIRAASEKWVKECGEKDAILSSLEDKNKVSVATIENLNKELESLKSLVADLQNKEVSRENEEKFNVRMTHFAETYDLCDEENQAIASDIKDLDDAGFDAYAKKMAFFLKDKNKENKKNKLAKEKEEMEAKASKIVVASVPTVDVAAVIDAGVKDAPIPNAQGGELSYEEKFRKAFTFDNCVKNVK